MASPNTANKPTAATTTAKFRTEMTHRSRVAAPCAEGGGGGGGVARETPLFGSVGSVTWRRERRREVQASAQIFWCVTIPGALLPPCRRGDSRLLSPAACRREASTRTHTHRHAHTHRHRHTHTHTDTHRHTPLLHRPELLLLPLRGAPAPARLLRFYRRRAGIKAPQRRSSLRESLSLRSDRSPCKWLRGTGGMSQSVDA